MEEAADTLPEMMPEALQFLLTTDGVTPNMLPWDGCSSMIEWLCYASRLEGSVPVPYFC